MTEGKNTVYLVSEGHSASAAAFTTVLSAELYHIAKTHGLGNEDDKIDPPLRMVLDEMNNVAAIPHMPDLITDSGGRGIQIWASCTAPCRTRSVGAASTGNGCRAIPPRHGSTCQA